MKNNREAMKDEMTSVCHWELYFEFKTKEQCKKFFNALFETDLIVKIEYEEIMEEKDTIFKGFVSSYWAHSLTTVAKLLEDVDHKCMDF